MTTPEDMAQCRTWSERLLARAADLPISFVLDGNLIQGITDAWQPSRLRRRVDANLVETVFEGTDPSSGLNLRVECWQYQDYPVIEWVAWLTNRGQAATPVISEIRAIDVAFNGTSAVVHHCNGDFNSAEGYTPQATALGEGQALAFAPVGGRACDQAFPYFRLAFDGWGLTLAIGWPAQWAARFTGLPAAVRVQAGQEKTNLRLMPGESVRTPRMTVLFWSGDASRAVNLWRRWYLAHVLPRPNGQPLPPLLACAATDEGEEFTAATAANQVRYLEAFHARGIRPDVWWIDAG